MCCLFYVFEVFLSFDSHDYRLLWPQLHITSGRSFIEFTVKLASEDTWGISHSRDQHV